MLGNKPLIAWVFEVLESINEIAEILPVFKKDDMALGCDLLEKFKFSKVKRIAPGGKERQDSVYSALTLIDKETDVVLIHDGVRPLVDRDLIERAIRELLIPSVPPLAKGGEGGFDGVVVGVPLKDTIKKILSLGSQGLSEVLVQKTLDRKSLWAIQTPQVFKYSVLMKAYRKAMDERFYSTDDSAIVEKYGGKVKAIMGSYSNIKITTPEDLTIAELLLRKRSESIS